VNEFELIYDVIAPTSCLRDDVLLGIGDDGAVLAPPPGQSLVVVADTLVAGRHFPPDFAPADIGYRAAAVNLSDIAAMGATPLWATLALTLPASDVDWVRGFAGGLADALRPAATALVGGDTTRGPLNLCITVFGSVPTAQALRRDGSGTDDEIWVSGTLGDARLALEALQGKLTLTQEQLATARPRLDRPQPRNTLGLALRGIATSAIDVSDGLLGDLGHILERCSGGAVLNADALPLGPALAVEPCARRLEFALNGGDDYELCFTAPAARHHAVIDAAQRAGVQVTCIGRRTPETGVRVIDAAGAPVATRSSSFDHFATP